MKQSVVQKPVVSPFLFTVFVAVAVTGILMFFHIKNGPIVVVHEWLGVVFAIAGLIHVILNFKQLLSYFKLTRAWVGASIALVLIVLFAIAGLNHKGGPRHPQGAGAPQAEQAGR